MNQNQTRSKEKQHKQEQQCIQVIPEKQHPSCPHCDAPINENGAYCEECGNVLRVHTCPSCNRRLDAGTDFCEHCHTFITTNQCTFCGETINENEPFCSECGAPAKGVICAECNQLSHTAFCFNCNTALTDMAIKEREKALHDPLYKQVMGYSVEITQMEKELEAFAVEHEIENTPISEAKPFKTEKEQKREKQNIELEALYQSLVTGENKPVTPVQQLSRGTQNIEERKERLKEKEKSRLELEQKIEQKRKELQQILSEMKPSETLSSQDMRNYYAARKPDISYGAWLCNYKNCYHPNPSCCGKPQMGGEWVVVNGRIE